jgi:serine/threonine protein kinase
MENRVFFNRYRLSLTGNGLPVELKRTSTAVLYRAQEIETGREVTLELVTTTISPGLRQVLEAEATVARGINHINIPKLYDFGFDRDDLVYVNEYCEGPTAAAWVAARGSLPAAAVLHVALQVVETLGAMAFHRIVHHSLNPDNIIFVGNQTTECAWPSIKVLHWLGVAPILGETGDPRLENAARFASPEQLHANVVEVPSEIYSLGATMYFLLTGRPPNTALEVGPGTAGSLAAELGGVPRLVRRVLGKMLQPDPDQRPQDLVALTAFLQSCLARVDRQEKTGRGFGIAAVVKSPTVLKRKQPPLSLKQAVVVVAVLVLALVAAFAWPRRFFAHYDSPAGTHSEMAGADRRNEMAVLPNKPIASKPHVVEARPTGPIVEVPRETMTSATEENPVVGQPPPPAEGPAESTVSISSSNVSSLGSERAASPGPNATPEAPAQSRDPGTTSPAKAASRSAKTTKSKAKRVAKKPRIQGRRSPAHVVKRAQPVPNLRVGSERAELVGTTSDGHWILSVGDSGKRVTVPPPPGFAPQ